jgi:hypothetical protein
VIYDDTKLFFCCSTAPPQSFVHYRPFTLTTIYTESYTYTNADTMKTTTTTTTAFIVALLLSLFVQVSTFSPQRTSKVMLVMMIHPQTMTTTTTMTTTKTMTTKTTTMLHYTIVSPPDNDNCELGDDNDSNCEESYFARKRQEKKDKDLELRNTYIANGLDVDSIDLAESVDQYRNAAGGGIIPGIQLSSLMLDD